MATVADRKLKIVQLHAMGLSVKIISEKISTKEWFVTENYIQKVIDEYNEEGTITVNSKLKNL